MIAITVRSSMRVKPAGREPLRALGEFEKSLLMFAGLDGFGTELRLLGTIDAALDCGRCRGSVKGILITITQGGHL